MNAPLLVMATGARTPLGLHSAASAASLRAAISSCSEHPYFVDGTGEPMPASLDGLLDPRLPCRERMLALARSAMQEAMLPLLAGGRQIRVPVLVGLPEPRPGFSEADAHWLRSQLAQQGGLTFVPGETQACLSGHSAALFLMDQARRDMAQGKYDMCLIGGVESYFHPDTLEWLDRNRQLVGPVSRSGFVPGEGAGFCLLMTAAAAHRCGLQPLALVTGSATAWESHRIKTDDVNMGAGLIEAVHAAVGSLQPPQERLNAIYCDINGERYRGEEWGFVCLKLARYFDDPTAYCSPADGWGDMGAASGGLQLMLAVQAAQRGYASGRRSLLWTSSENGLRAAVLLEADVIPSAFRG